MLEARGCGTSIHPGSCLVDYTVAIRRFLSVLCLSLDLSSVILISSISHFKKKNEVHVWMIHNFEIVVTIAGDTA